MSLRAIAPVALLLSTALFAFHTRVAADNGNGGPVVLLGIDAEDRWRSSVSGREGGRHGEIEDYLPVVQNVLAKVTNERDDGILVIGGGKSPIDDVTTFWLEIGERVERPVTFVNTAERIRSITFNNFEMLVVVSDNTNTPFGGLTDAENDALTERQTDIAKFINSGGGLFGLTSDFTFSDPYGYIGGIGGFSTVPNLDPPFRVISPTQEGLALGITTDLSVCCWHDLFEDFPDFLQVLAVEPERTGLPAALGGVAVSIGPPAAVTGYMKLGGGAIANTGVRHWFHLGCDPLARSTLQRLRVRFNRSTEFHMDSMLAASCTGATPKRGKGNFDTHIGSGSGRLNNAPGVYSVTWTFTDSGTHKGDSASIVIRDPSGNTVLNVSGNLSQGDQQAFGRTKK
jgi:hypothetical protein